MKKLQLTLAVAALTAAVHAKIAVDAPGHVYTEKEAPSAQGGTPGAAWTLTDWRGRTVASGTWSADGRAKWDVLPTGYYHVKSGADDATFAVVPIPERRPFNHDSFYAVDSAQSWVSNKGTFDCPWLGGDTFRLVSDLIWKTGLPHVRERLAWRDVEPKPGAFDYGRYLYNADLLRHRKILVSGMFHDAPKFADPIVKLPRDLVALYTFTKNAAATFGDRMGDWEFWNEEDIAFAPEPVWDYMSAMKAAYLGFKAGRGAAPVLNGALCTGPGSSDYWYVLFQNDLAKYSEVFNFHTYNALANYPKLFANLRAFMKDVGIGDRAIWMTETGTNLEGHSQGDGVRKGVKAHSPEQELIHAEFYAKSQVLLQMEGVARNYFFVFGAYNERGGVKDWGVMRRDGTVKPTYAAMSAIVRELGRARLEGEVKLGDKVKAYLFTRPDGTQTLAFWAVSPVDTRSDTVSATPDFATTCSVKAPDGTYRLSDLCGHLGSATATAGRLDLAATRYPAYVSGLRGLAPDVRPVPAGKVETYTPKADEDLSVVFRVDLDAKDFENAAHKSLATLKTDAGRIRLQIWNLSDTPKRGRVDVAGGVRLDGVPATIDLPAWGKAEYATTLHIQDMKGYYATVVLTGVFNDRRTSRLTLPVRFDKHFLANCTSVPLAANAPKAWKRNTSADDFKVSWDEAEKAVRFDLSWKSPNSDRWFYPVYDLKLPVENLTFGSLLEFEVKSVQNKVENDYKCQFLMLVPQDGSVSDRFISYAPALTTWEKRRVEIGAFDEKALRKSAIKSIRLGGNPSGTTCTFWIRNLRILKPKDAAGTASLPSAR